ncbi:hypothetical protein [Methylobacterium haplocladii]|uniref:Uncharacterized protein n=1 Tax=Methylobacterium haplocladii TaxID=1176176 RepID=A0A512IKC0_9HYPH|nr:hypothetical protein [Methylobacterium haplocladii]GEO98149.1 hypothetical protein MHA02_05370 [Methylobacterium haplocladii]GJD83604.1 hypothetical protein HPGCJGGD_1473 [Methylobacterium haplocladii]GLS60332.1 hypothetical protein GCM10007887_30110 [Methylobacterium haplocladii]
MGALETLGHIQVARAGVFAEKLAANPIRAVALGSFRQRNTLLDAVFYDVDAVTPAETDALAADLAHEGAVVLVPSTGQGVLTVYEDASAYLAGRAEVDALTVAGVGSSALGAAAFARNVADALGGPVAAVVSGYGLADVLTEALGGFFLFGGLNSIRHVFEPLDGVSRLFSADRASLELADGVAWARTSQDTLTVRALLSDKRFRPRHLIGHSKGNLVISEALYTIASENNVLAKRLAERTRIVTFSAKIGMPAPFRDVIDVMGGMDWFGALNSRPDIPADHVVPQAGHSTNPDIPVWMGLGAGIRVTPTLRDVLSPAAERIAAPAPLAASAIFDLPQRMTVALHDGAALRLA